jgi:hypothetical protein
VKALALLTERELGELLSRFQRTAFRFEVRDRYNSDVGREAFRRFMAGEPDDLLWHQAWLEKLRDDHQHGKRWQRVRIVTVPVSDWTRYGIRVGRLNVQAGEDIRYLRRSVAEALGLQPYDAWLLDNEQLIGLHFDDQDDTFVGAEVITDAATVQQHRGWQQLAWQHAEPLEDFAASLP